MGGGSGAARELGLNRNTAFSLARKAGMNFGHQGHPQRQEYEKLRVQGLSRREAAERTGVHPRTAKDWDNEVRPLLAFTSIVCTLICYRRLAK